jgi:hypothetical protein
MNSVIYKKIDENLIQEWQFLWEQSVNANYTNAPQWFLAAIDAFCFEDYAIIAVYEKEKLVAAGALVKEKKYGVDFYNVAPSDFACGTPFLIDLKNQEAVLEFKKQLLDLGNIFLSNIPKEFLEAFGENTLVIDKECSHTINYYLTMQKDSNGQVLLKKRNKLTHEIRGMQEKFTLHSYDGTDSDGLDKAFALDNQSRKQGRGYNTFNSPLIRKFYKSLANHFENYFLVNILYFENTPIAYEIGFLIAGNYFGSQMAYITEYKQYSPGKVIFVKLGDLLVSKNVAMWDLGSGDSPVKKLVTEEKRELYESVLSNNIFVKNYSKQVGRLRNYVFDHLHNHIKIYSVYRKLKTNLPPKHV